MIKKTILFLVVALLIAVVTIIYIGINQGKLLNEVQLARLNTATKIPFYYSKTNHIVINVAIQGEKYPFILDSGASSHIFGNLKSKVQNKKTGIGLVLGVNYNLLFPDIIQIDNLEFGGALFSKINFMYEETLPFDCSDHIYGIIGKEVMQHLVWQIDFENQEIILDTKLQESTNEDAIVINLQKSRGHKLYAQMYINADTASTKFNIDLGMNGSFLIDSSDLNTPDSKKIEIKGRSLTGIDGAYKAASYFQLINKIVIDGYTFENAPFEVNKKTINLLGLGFLKNFKTTISWKDKKLILVPYDTDFKMELKGFGFKPFFDKDANQLKVKYVVQCCPSSNLRLMEPGDLIVSIDNEKITTQEQFCNLDINSKDTLSISILKKDKVIDLTLVKQNYFNN